MRMIRDVAGVGVLLALATPCVCSAVEYAWPHTSSEGDRLDHRIPPPTGFVREDAAAGSFTAWLRGLPLKPGRPAVRLFDGRLKANQEAHHAVLDMDVGSRDLQQCADAVMRLRAEYLYAAGAIDRVRFDVTTGAPASLAGWFEGDRPVVRRNALSWARTGPRESSYASMRRFLDVVFTYAGSASLARQLRPVTDRDLQPGDVFIQGGFPGHAVLVADVARGPAGRSTFLLVQSYMPAQELHVLRNPADQAQGPWYEVSAGSGLATPEWTFGAGALRRFP
jgi:Domain of unknown function (4846)